MTTQTYVTTRHTTVRAMPADLDTIEKLANGSPQRGRPPRSHLPRVEPCLKMVRFDKGMLESVNDDGQSALVLLEGMIPRDLALMFMRIAAAYPGAAAE